MKFYDDFIGEDSINIQLSHQHGTGDSLENFNINKETQPEDWYYRDKTITYSFNSYGHRSKEVKDLDFDNYLLFIGCSHTQGVGVELEKTYPNLVSSNLKCDYYNLAISATGIDVVEYNLLTWFFKFNKKPKAVIAQLPDHSRFISMYPGYDNLLPNGSWNATNDKDVGKLLFNGEETGAFHARKNISYRLINTVVQCPLIKLNYNGHAAYSDTGDIPFRRLDLARDLSHPGIKSHEAVADNVYSMLRSQVK